MSQNHWTIDAKGGPLLLKSGEILSLERQEEIGRAAKSAWQIGVVFSQVNWREF
jgi:hypothetical protein